jgi:DNA-directed RNA polymerase subunit RPC12/RpoP
VAAVVAGLAMRDHEPGSELVIGFNALMPGTGLAAAGRPLFEVAFAVILAQAGMLAVGKIGNPFYWLPVAALGGFWGSLHTPFSILGGGTPRRRQHSRPIVTSTSRSPVGGPRATAPPPARGPVQPVQQVQQVQAKVEAEEEGYSVTVRCSECGADAEVPVLNHMAECSYCGSKHMVTGQDETLHLALPERCTGPEQLRDALLDHFRYQHYLKLYKRQVAALEGGTTSISPEGGMYNSPEMELAAAAAEAAVSRQADAYRERLAGQLKIGKTMHFLAPYRHGMGTLYQAAFGRCKRSEDKQLRFAIGTIEASTLANSLLDLPDMGKLSYLRALVPVAKYPAGVKALTLELDEAGLDKAYGDLDRKQLVRDIRTIRLGSAFFQHVSAVLWRPYWIVETQGPGINESYLVDSATGSVAGVAPYINPEVLVDLPAEATAPGAGVRFQSMECPTCGHEFLFEADAVLHYCSNCHRVCGVHHDQKYEVEYSHVPMPEAPGFDMVPYWGFQLRLRTEDGKLITDLMHLKDGIDGTMDQLGDDAQMKQHGFLVPAIRCINARLMADAFNRLFVFALKAGSRPVSQRFPLDVKPMPWQVCLEEVEARRLAPLILANAFTSRDIAKVNVHQVASWLLKARLESKGRLVYLPVPVQITRPFRDYVGRFHGQALEQAKRGPG